MSEDPFVLTKGPIRIWHCAWPDEFQYSIHFPDTRKFKAFDTVRRLRLIEWDSYTSANGIEINVNSKFTEEFKEFLVSIGRDDILWLDHGGSTAYNAVRQNLTNLTQHQIMLFKLKFM